MRTFESEKILCVANLSRFAQPTELDLSRFEGLVPVEMLGYVEFPKIRKTPYALTLAPYGYFWFELQTSAQTAGIVEELVSEEPALDFSSWAELMSGPARPQLEHVLPQFLLRQRWFGSKARHIDRVGIRELALVPDLDVALLLIDVQYFEGPQETYFLPLVRLSVELARSMRERFPQASVARCRGDAGEIFDGTVDEGLSQWLLQVVGEGRRVPFGTGTLVGATGQSFAALRGDSSQPLAAQPSTGEQSNTSIRFGDRIIMKVFRRLEPGPNPDCEVTRYLSDERGNAHVPSFVGALHYQPRDGEPVTLGMFQNLVDNQGDGWSWTLEELGRYYESRATVGFAPGFRPLLRRPTLSSLGDILSSEAVDSIGLYVKAAATLARRTAEMHIDSRGRRGRRAVRAGLHGARRGGRAGAAAARARRAGLRRAQGGHRALPGRGGGARGAGARADGGRSPIASGPWRTSMSGCGSRASMATTTWARSCG